jgi:hypothetical protein
MYSKPEEITKIPKNFDLPHGRDLNPAEAFCVSGRRPTKVIVLAGAVSSGKTTLVTSIYEKFQEGPFVNFSFAGSSTLPGFEERSHRGRMASEAEEPDTERTKLKTEQQFLHLAVRNNTTQAARDLLITDVSGEKFRLARDFAEECKKLVILKRADVFALLIDGGRLASSCASKGVC